MSDPHRLIRSPRLALPIVFAFLALGGLEIGCAPKRIILDLHREISAHSANGVPVKITSVTDQRAFKRLPKEKKRHLSADPNSWISGKSHPFVPQLETGGFDDPTTTVRAVARLFTLMYPFESPRNIRRFRVGGGLKSTRPFTASSTICTDSQEE